jgi:F-type H+-transporting ATPase subunit delta
MISDTVADRYAEALFLLGKEKQILSDLDRELRLAETIFDAHPRLARAFEAPYVPHKAKMDMVARLLTGKTSAVVVNFFMLLVEKGREPFRKAIVRLFRELLEEHEGFITCSVETAFPLEGPLRETVEEWVRKATGKKPRLAVTVNPDLIAGMVIRIKDRYIDLSVQGQLRAAARSLLKAA